MLLNEPSGTKLLISDRKQGSMIIFKGLPHQVFCSKVPLTLNSTSTGAHFQHMSIWGTLIMQTVAGTLLVVEFLDSKVGFSVLKRSI